jgi:oligosaccharide repeat unit polymerase
MVESVNNPRLPDAPNAAPDARAPFLFRQSLSNLASPYGLAMISYAFFLFACLIPPSVYSHYMMEPDLMFLDPASILFYTLCVVSFLAGAWFVKELLPSSFVDPKFETRISPTAFLMVPLTVGIMFTAASLFLLIEYNPDIIVFLMTQQGGELKELVATEVASSFNLAPLTLTAIVWWAFWRSSELRLNGWRNRLVKSALVVAILSVIAAATLVLSRDILMMVACGLAALYAIRRNTKKPVSFRFVLAASTAIAVCVALLFFGFSFLRGVSSWDDQIHTLVGYTAASYNRLAAVVNGNLRYPFAHRGLYLSSFVAFNHTWNRFVPLGSVMSWPTQLDDWSTQFEAVSRAGLDGTLIWSGAFGYIFSDLGWFSLPFVFGYGVLYGIAWNWIKRGKALGVVLYPCLAFCVLFWVGANILLDSQRAVVSVVAIILAGYELVFVRRKRVRLAKQELRT